MTHISAPKPTRKTAKLAEILALWNTLPDEALVPLPVVCAIRGRSPASIWRDVVAGRLAKPVSAGPRCTRWKVGDLRNSI
jgi:hypothetical protein